MMMIYYKNKYIFGMSSVLLYSILLHIKILYKALRSNDYKSFLSLQYQFICILCAQNNYILIRLGLENKKKPILRDNPALCVQVDLSLQQMQQYEFLSSKAQPIIHSLGQFSLTFYTTWAKYVILGKNFTSRFRICCHFQDF